MHFSFIKYNLIKGCTMFYKCYNNRNILIKGDYIMSIKLIKASYEYQDLIVDMLKEWIDYNNNHPLLVEHVLLKMELLN